MNTRTLPQTKSLLITSVNHEKLEFKILNEHSEIEAIGSINIYPDRSCVLFVDNPTTRNRMKQGIETARKPSVFKGEVWEFSGDHILFNFRHLDMALTALNTWS